MADFKPKVQPCRNGCGTEIIVKQSDGKWKPFVAATGELHECPNSDYNRKKGFTSKVQQTIDTSNLENQIQAVLTEILDTKRIVKDFFEAYVKDKSFNKAEDLVE